MTKAKLYLIPSTIASDTEKIVIPPHITNELHGLTYFLAENTRTARRYLSSLKIFESIEALHFDTLDKNTTPKELDVMLQPLQEGTSIGIISESGCPGIADPGELGGTCIRLKRAIRITRTSPNWSHSWNCSPKIVTSFSSGIPSGWPNSESA